LRRAAAAAAALAVSLSCNAGRSGPSPGAAAPPPVAGSALPLAAEPASFDFGRVLPRHSVQKEFRLRNLGRDTLAIDSVVTDCGCMVVGEYARALPPGGSTALTVMLETPPSPGTVQRSLVVKTPAGSLQVRIRATVVGDGG
jgi:uncharacterized protein DUF1573